MNSSGQVDDVCAQLHIYDSNLINILLKMKEILALSQPATGTNQSRSPLHSDSNPLFFFSLSSTALMQFSNAGHTTPLHVCVLKKTMHGDGYTPKECHSALRNPLVISAPYFFFTSPHKIHRPAGILELFIGVNRCGVVCQEYCSYASSLHVSAKGLHLIFLNPRLISS